MHIQNVKFLSSQYSISATVTTPDQATQAPCVVMVHGSGAQDRDGNISGFNTNIFKFISECLAENGIASLRYDKRGVGKSEGNFKVAGLTEMVNDACTAIKFASQIPGVDQNNIFVLGHSEGAVLAPEIALRCPDVAGIIMLCASLRSFEQDGVKNAEVLNRDLDKIPGLRGKIAGLLFYTKDPLKTMQKLRRKVETTKAKRIWVSFTRVSTKFYRETFNYDVKRHLKVFSKPILAIGGEKDFQCHPDDTRQIPSATNAQVDTHIIDNMDHTLRLQTEAPSIMNYKASTNEPIIDDVNTLIVNWVNNQSTHSKNTTHAE